MTKFFNLTAIVILLCLQNTATAASFAALEKLIAEQQYQAAYDLAHSLALKNEGDPKFDFLYGKAANYAHHSDIAVFALERVVVKQPKNEAALFELGRAYYDLKEYDAAEKMFRRMVKYPSLAQPYLSKLSDKKDQSSVKKFFNFEISGGYDTNADGITNNGIPTFPPKGFPAGQKSWINTFSATAGIVKKLADKKSALFAVAGTSYRDVYAAHKFDALEMFAMAGLATKLGSYELTLPVKVSQTLIGKLVYDNSIGIKAAIDRPFLNKTHVLGVDVEVERLRYPQTRSQNGYLTTLGGHWGYRPAAVPLQTNVRLMYATGKANDITGAFLMRDYYGTEVSAKWKGLARQTPNLTLSYYHSRYNGIDPHFMSRRVDDFYSVHAGWEYRLGKGFAIEPSYQFGYSKSSQEAFSYRRHIVQLALKGQFNG